VSIFGGRGTILGVVLSVAIVGSLQMALTQMNVSADKQNIVTGVLLLISVIVPNAGAALRRIQERTQRRTKPSTKPSTKLQSQRSIPKEGQPS
jgi:rhamnose transport system permease protein